MTNLLTNYIDKRNGNLYHGSELSYSAKFKTDNYQKIKSYQCNQNMPYWNGEIDDAGNMIIVRKLYGKEVFECTVEKIN